MHIAIAGNIGSGKTTLTNLLSKQFDWQIHHEEVANNPYLNDFYGDMKRWAFNLEVFFLNNRFKQVLDIKASGNDVIQDRTIYEGALIFAANLHSMGSLSTRDFENYTSLFDLMTSFVTPPDLLIYLKASVPTLVKQIKQRGREYESDIEESYLVNLNQRYQEWIGNYKQGNLLVLEVDELDLLNQNDFNGIVNKVNEKLLSVNSYQ
jgi:deoxyadenosine/deoxycytidine kinase